MPLKPDEVYLNLDEFAHYERVFIDCNGPQHSHIDHENKRILLCRESIRDDQVAETMPLDKLLVYYPWTINGSC